MRRTPFIGQINGVFLCHVEQSILMNYAKRYCVNNGDKGIKPINNKYSGKFKEDVLAYYYSHNMLLGETAAHFNIPSFSTITTWISIYEKDGVSGLYEERRGRSLKKKSSRRMKY